MNRKIETLEDFDACVKRLRALLDDPHPGLSMWVKMFGEEMNLISAWWLGANSKEAK